MDLVVLVSISDRPALEGDLLGGLDLRSPRDGEFPRDLLERKGDELRERDVGEEERDGLRDPARDEDREIAGCERLRLGVRGLSRRLELRLKGRWTDVLEEL